MKFFTCSGVECYKTILLDGYTTTTIQLSTSKPLTIKCNILLCFVIVGLSQRNIECRDKIGDRLIDCWFRTSWPSLPVNNLLNTGVKTRKCFFLSWKAKYKPQRFWLFRFRIKKSKKRFRVISLQPQQNPLASSLSHFIISI